MGKMIRLSWNPTNGGYGYTYYAKVGEFSWMWERNPEFASVLDNEQAEKFWRKCQPDAIPGDIIEIVDGDIIMHERKLQANKWR